MSENTAREVPGESPQHASSPETRERPTPEDQQDTADETGAVPLPGQEPQDNPDAEAEERFDAG